MANGDDNNNYMSDDQINNYLQSVGEQYDNQPPPEEIEYLRQKDIHMRSRMANTYNFRPADINQSTTSMTDKLGEYNRLGIDYRVGMDTEQEDLYQSQSAWEKFSNAGYRAMTNTYYDTIGGIGSMLDWEDYFNADDEIGNSWQKWAEKGKAAAAEDAPIYQQEGAGMGNFAWWMENGSSLVGSIAAFGIQGALLGGGMGLIGKGVKAVKNLSKIGQLGKSKAVMRNLDNALNSGKRTRDVGANILDKVSTAGVINAKKMAGKFGQNLVHSTMMNQSESIMSATQVYDDAYKKAKEQGYSEDYAKRLAATAGSNVVNLNRINIALNLTTAGKFLRGTNSITSMVKKRNWRNQLVDIGQEGFQESGEEAVNLFAEKQSNLLVTELLGRPQEEELAAKQRRAPDAPKVPGTVQAGGISMADTYKGIDISNPFGDASTKEIIETMALGALGGIAQTGMIKAVDAKVKIAPTIMGKTFNLIGGTEDARYAQNQYYADGSIKARKGDVIYETEDATYQENVIDEDTGEVKHKKGDIVYKTSVDGEQDAVKVLKKDKRGKPNALKVGEVDESTGEKTGGKAAKFTRNQLHNRRIERLERDLKPILDQADKFNRLMGGAKYQNQVESTIASIEDYIDKGRGNMDKATTDVMFEKLATLELLHEGETQLTPEQVKERQEKLMTEELSEKDLRTKQDELLEMSLAQTAAQAFELGYKNQLKRTFALVANMSEEEATSKGYGENYKENALETINKIDQYHNRWVEYNAKHSPDIARGLFFNRLQRDRVNDEVKNINDDMKKLHDSEYEKYTAKEGLDENNFELKTKYDQAFELEKNKQIKINRDKKLLKLNEDKAKLEKELTNLIVTADQAESPDAFQEKVNDVAEKLENNETAINDRVNEITKPFDDKIEALELPNVNSGISKQSQFNQNRLQKVETAIELDNKFDKLRSKGGQAELENINRQKRLDRLKNLSFINHMNHILELQKNGGGAVYGFGENADRNKKMYGRVILKKVGNDYVFEIAPEEAFLIPNDQKSKEKYQNALRPDLEEEYNERLDAYNKKLDKYKTESKPLKEEISKLENEKIKLELEIERSTANAKKDVSDKVKKEFKDKAAKLKTELSNVKKQLASKNKSLSSRKEKLNKERASIENDKINKYNYYKFFPTENNEFLVVQPAGYKNAEQVDKRNVWIKSPVNDEGKSTYTTASQKQLKAGDKVFYLNKKDGFPIDENTGELNPNLEEATVAVDFNGNNESEILISKAESIEFKATFETLNNIELVPAKTMPLFEAEIKLNRILNNRISRIRSKKAQNEKDYEDLVRTQEEVENEEQALNEELELYMQAIVALDADGDINNLNIPEAAQLKMLQLKMRDALIGDLKADIIEQQRIINTSEKEIEDVQEKLNNTEKYIDSQLELLNSLLADTSDGATTKPTRRKAEEKPFDEYPRHSEDKRNYTASKDGQKYHKKKKLSNPEYVKKQINETRKRIRDGEYSGNRLKKALNDLKNSTADIEKAKERLAQLENTLQAINDQKNSADLFKMLSDIKAVENKKTQAMLLLDRNNIQIETLSELLNIYLSSNKNFMNQHFRSKKHFNNFTKLVEKTIKQKEKRLKEARQNDPNNDILINRLENQLQKLNILYKVDIQSITNPSTDTNINNTLDSLLIDKVITNEQYNEIVTEWTRHVAIENLMESMSITESGQTKTFTEATQVLFDTILDLKNQSSTIQSQIDNLSFIEEQRLSKIWNSSISMINPEIAAKLFENAELEGLPISQYESMITELKASLDSRVDGVMENRNQLTDQMNAIKSQKEQLNAEYNMVGELIDEINSITENVSGDDLEQMESIIDEFSREGQEQMIAEIKQEITETERQLNVASALVNTPVTALIMGNYSISMADNRDELAKFKEMVDGLANTRIALEKQKRKIELLYGDFSDKIVVSEIINSAELKNKKLKKKIKEYNNSQKNEPKTVDTIEESAEDKKIYKEISKFENRKEDPFTTAGKQLLYDSVKRSRIYTTIDGVKSPLFANNPSDIRWFDYLNQIDEKTLKKDYALQIVKSKDAVASDPRIKFYSQNGNEFTDIGDGELVMLLVDKATGKIVESEGNPLYITFASENTIDRLNKKAVFNAFVKAGAKVTNTTNKKAIGRTLESLNITSFNAANKKNLVVSEIELNGTKYKINSNEDSGDYNKMRTAAINYYQKEMENFRNEVNDLLSAQQVFVAIKSLSEGDLLRTEPNSDGTKNMKSNFVNEFISSDQFDSFVFTSAGGGTQGRVNASTLVRLPGIPYIKLKNGTLIDTYSKKVNDDDINTLVKLLDKWIALGAKAKLVDGNNEAPIFNQKGIKTPGLINKIINWNKVEKDPKSLNFNINYEKKRLEYYSPNGKINYLSFSTLSKVANNKPINSTEKSKHNAFVDHMKKNKVKNVNKSLLQTTKGPQAETYLHPYVDSNGKLKLREYKASGGRTAYMNYIIDNNVLETDVLPASITNQLNNGQDNPRVGRYVTFSNSIANEAKNVKEKEVIRAEITPVEPENAGESLPDSEDDSSVGTERITIEPTLLPNGSNLTMMKEYAVPSVHPNMAYAIINDQLGKDQSETYGRSLFIARKLDENGKIVGLDVTVSYYKNGKIVTDKDEIDTHIKNIYDNNDSRPIDKIIDIYVKQLKIDKKDLDITVKNITSKKPLMYQFMNQLASANESLASEIQSQIDLMEDVNNFSKGTLSVEKNLTLYNGYDIVDYTRPDGIRKNMTLNQTKELSVVQDSEFFPLLDLMAKSNNDKIRFEFINSLGRRKIDNSIVVSLRLMNQPEKITPTIIHELTHVHTKEYLSKNPKSNEAVKLENIRKGVIKHLLENPDARIEVINKLKTQDSSGKDIDKLFYILFGGVSNSALDFITLLDKHTDNGKSTDENADTLIKEAVKIVRGKKTSHASLKEIVSFVMSDTDFQQVLNDIDAASVGVEVTKGKSLLDAILELFTDIIKKIVGSDFKVKDGSLLREAILTTSEIINKQGGFSQAKLDNLQNKYGTTPVSDGQEKQPVSGDDIVDGEVVSPEFNQETVQNKDHVQLGNYSAKGEDAVAVNMEKGIFAVSDGVSTGSIVYLTSEMVSRAMVHALTNGINLSSLDFDSIIDFSGVVQEQKQATYSFYYWAKQARERVANGEITLKDLIANEIKPALSKNKDGHTKNIMQDFLIKVIAGRKAGRFQGKERPYAAATLVYAQKTAPNTYKVSRVGDSIYAVIDKNGKVIKVEGMQTDQTTTAHSLEVNSKGDLVFAMSKESTTTIKLEPGQRLLLATDFIETQKALDDFISTYQNDGFTLEDFTNKHKFDDASYVVIGYDKGGVIDSITNTVTFEAKEVDLNKLKLSNNSGTISAEIKDTGLVRFIDQNGKVIHENMDGVDLDYLRGLANQQSAKKPSESSSSFIDLLEGLISEDEMTRLYDLLPKDSDIQDKYELASYVEEEIGGKISDSEGITTLEELYDVIQDVYNSTDDSPKFSNNTRSVADSIGKNTSEFKEAIEYMISETESFTAKQIEQVVLPFLSTGEYLQLSKTIKSSELFKQYKEGFGKNDYDTILDVLTELFNNYRNNEQINPYVKNLFDNIQNFYNTEVKTGNLENYFINNVDNRISTSEDLLPVFNTKIEIDELGLSQEDSKAIIDGLTSYLFTHFKNVDSDQFFNNKLDLTGIYDNIRRKTSGNLKDTIVKTIKSIDKFTKKRQIEENRGLSKKAASTQKLIEKLNDKLESLKTIREAFFMRSNGNDKWNKLVIRHVDRMRAYGIKVDTDSLLDELEATGDAAFNRNTGEIDHKLDMPPVVKLWIASRSRKNWDTSTGTYKTKRNKLGFPELHEFDEMYNYVARKTANLPPDASIMFEELTKAYHSEKATSDKASALAELVGADSIFNSRDDINATLNDVRLLGQIVQTFSKQTPEFFLMTAMEDGNYTTYNANSRKTSNKVFRVWKQNYIDQLDETAKGKVLDLFEAQVILNGLTSGNESSFQNALEKLGIIFDDWNKANEELQNIKGTDETIMDIVNAKNGIKDHLKKVVDQINKHNETADPDNQINDLGRYMPYEDFSLHSLKLLSEAQANSSFEIMDNQFISADNKTIYGITMNHYMSLLLNKINYYSGNEEMLRKKLPHLFNVFNKNSAIKPMMLDSKNPIKIQTTVFNGFTYGPLGETIKDISEPNRWTMFINSTLANHPVYTYYRAADRSIENGFRFVNKRTNQPIKLFDNFIGARNAMLGYLKDEINTIYHFKRNNLGENVKFYQKKADKFRFFSGDEKYDNILIYNKYQNSQEDLGSLIYAEIDKAVEDEKDIDPFDIINNNKELSSKLLVAFKQFFERRSKGYYTVDGKTIEGADADSNRDMLDSTKYKLKKLRLLDKIPDSQFETEVWDPNKGKHGGMVSKTLDRNGRYFNGISADIFNTYASRFNFKTKKYSDEQLDMILDEILLDFDSIQFAAYVEQSKIITGDPAMFKHEDDFFKRQKMYNSTKKISNIDPKFNEQMNNRNGGELYIDLIVDGETIQTPLGISVTALEVRVGELVNKTLDKAQSRIDNAKIFEGKSIKNLKVKTDYGYRKDGKTFDNRINTMILEDVEITSMLADDTVNKITIENGKIKYYNGDAKTTPSELTKLFAEEFYHKDGITNPVKLTAKVLSYTKEYKGYEEGDGQAYVTLDEYKEILLRAGDWSPEQDRAWSKIQQGENLSIEDIFLFPVLKTQYTGPLSLENSNNAELNFDDILDQNFENNNLYIPSGYKHSIFPLIPQVVRGNAKLESLLNAMEDNQLGIAQFGSGIKYGVVVDENGNNNNFYNEDGQIIYEKVDGVPMFNGKPLQIQTIQYEYFGIQVDQAPKMKGKITVSSQFRKLILSNLMSNGMPVDARNAIVERIKSRYVNFDSEDSTYQDIRIQNEWNNMTEAERKKASEIYELQSEYIEIQGELIKLPLNELIDELDIEPIVSTDSAGNEQIEGYKMHNREALVDVVAESSKDRGVPDNVIASINSLLETDVYIEQVIGKEKVEQILNALVNNRVIREKRKGEMSPQVSSAGFETGLAVLENGKLVDKTGRPINGKKVKGVKDLVPESLKTYRKGKNGKTLPAEVMISLPKDWNNWVNQKYKGLDNFNKELDKFFRKLEQIEESGSQNYLSAEEDNLLKLITLIGFRIPTQGLNSSDFLRVRRFLPTTSANSVIVPSEMIPKAGSDFDIDKLSLYLAYYSKPKKVGNEWVAPQYTTYYDKDSSLNDRYNDYVDGISIDNINESEEKTKILNAKALLDDHFELYSDEKTEVEESINRSKIKSKELNETFKKLKEDGQLSNLNNFNLQMKMTSETWSILPNKIKNIYKKAHAKVTDSFEKFIATLDVSEEIIENAENYFNNVLTDKDKEYFEDVEGFKDTIQMYHDQVQVAADLYIGSKDIKKVMSTINKERSIRVAEYDTKKNLYNQMMKDKEAVSKYIKEQVREYKINNVEGIMSKEEFSRLPIVKQNNRKSLENRMLELHYEIMSLESNYRQLFAPVSDAILNDSDIGTVWDVRFLSSNSDEVGFLMNMRENYLLGSISDPNNVAGYISNGKIIMNNQIPQSITPNEVILTPEALQEFSDAMYPLYLEARRQWVSKDKEERKSKPLSQIASPSVNMEKFKSFLSGKAGVSQTAVHITHHQLGAATNLYLRTDNPFWIFDYNITFVGDTIRPAFSGIKDAQGEYISETLSAYMNAYVDVAADDYIYDLNAGNSTANTIMMMVRAGAPAPWIARFMKQPVIMNYVKEQAANESIPNKIYKLEHSKNTIVAYLTNTKKEDRLSYWNDKIDSYVNDLYKEYLIAPDNSTEKAEALEALKDYKNDLTVKKMQEIIDSIWNNINQSKEANLFSEEKMADYITYQSFKNAKLDIPIGLQYLAKNEEAMYNMVQAQMLDMYLEYQRQSKHFQELIRATSSDTKGLGKSRDAIANSLNTLTKIKAVGMFGNIGNLIDDTIVKEFQKTTEESYKMYKELYLIDQTPSLKEAKDILYNKYESFQAGEVKRIRLYDVITNDMLSAIVSIPFDNNDEFSTRRIYEELFVSRVDDKFDRTFNPKYTDKRGNPASLAKVIGEIKSLKAKELHLLPDDSSVKKLYWLRNNILIKELTPSLATEELTYDEFSQKSNIIIKKPKFDFLRLENRKMTTIRSNDLTEGYELIKEQFPEFAKDLMRLSMAQSGLNTTPFTFTKLIPNSEINLLLKEKISKFKELPEEMKEAYMYEFMKQFEQRNIKITPNLNRIKKLDKEGDVRHSVPTESPMGQLRQLFTVSKVGDDFAKFAAKGIQSADNKWTNFSQFGKYKFNEHQGIVRGEESYFVGYDLSDNNIINEYENKAKADAQKELDKFDDDSEKFDDTVMKEADNITSEDLDDRGKDCNIPF